MRSGGKQTAPDLLEQMGYETRDIVLPRIFFWIGVLFVFAAVSFFVAWMMYIFFIPDWAKLGQPSTIPVNRRLPPNPQIQIEPRRDMALYRTAEDNALNPEGVDKAIDNIATERGISGVKGDTVKGRGDSYPGSGNYAAPSGGDTGNTNASNTEQEGHEMTAPNASPAPMETPSPEATPSTMPSATPGASTAPPGPAAP